MTNKIRIRVRLPRPVDRDDDLLDLVPTVRPAVATIRPTAR